MTARPTGAGRFEELPVRAIPFVIAGALLLPAAALAQSVTDPQIAAIVVTANQVDIDAGALAASSTNAEVKAFAKLMVTDHEGVNRAAVELVKRLKVTPEENATSLSLKAGGEKNLSTLRGCGVPRSTGPTSITRSRTTSRCSTRSTPR
jgi:putative membrane protein